MATRIAHPLGSPSLTYIGGVGNLPVVEGDALPVLAPPERGPCTCNAGIQFYGGCAGCPVCGAAKAIPADQAFGVVARIVRR